MIILPAIDIRGGKCVRLTQGDYAVEKVYDDDPVAVARMFESEGATWIHVVDLDAAKAGYPVNLEIVRRIAADVSAPVQYGGGVRTLETAHQMMAAGVARCVVGSALAQDRDLARAFFHEFGEGVVAGLDAREGRIATVGWTEDSGLDVFAFALNMVELGARRIVLTDIARDGMLSGPNVELLERMVATVPIPIVQSGGISNAEDVRAVRRSGAEGVIIGKAIYEGNLTVRDAVIASS